MSAMMAGRKRGGELETLPVNLETDPNERPSDPAWRNADARQAGTYGVIKTASPRLFRDQ